MWMVLVTLLFAIFGVLIKAVGDGLPVVQTAFLRFLLGLVFLLPAVPQLLATRYTKRIIKLALLRAVLHAVSMLAWFYAIIRIPIAEVTAMNFMYPIYVTIGSVMLFGERISWPRICALAIGFIGALVILRPGMRVLDAGHYSMLICAIFIAGSYLLAGRLSKELPAGVVVALMSLIVPVLIAPFAIAHWVTPSLEQLGILFATAFFATAAHYCMTRAFACAQQTVLQPVNFAQLIWASAAGWVWFGEGIDAFVLLGGGMIVGAVSFVAYLEARARNRAEMSAQTSSK